MNEILTIDIFTELFNRILNLLGEEQMSNLTKTEKEIALKIRSFLIKANELINNKSYENALVVISKAKEMLLENNLNLKIEGQSLLVNINNMIFDINQKIKKDKLL